MKFKAPLNESALKALLALSMAVYSYWLSSQRTWRTGTAPWAQTFSDTFFTRQAVSMLHGHLDVNGPTYLADGECLYRAGKCYGYFGIFPSIVRLPFILVLNSTNIPLQEISIGLAAGLAMWATLEVASHVLDSPVGEGFPEFNRRLILLVFGMLLGPSSALVMLSQARVYREAIIWVVALTMVSISFALRSMVSMENKHLAVALGAAVAATNSRPTVIPMTVTLGAWLCYLAYRNRTFSLSNARTRLVLAILFLPTATSLMVFYLKVGMIFPSNSLRSGYPDSGIRPILALNGGRETGLRFAVTNLAQYLRPDSISYSLWHPWAHVLVPWEKAPIVVNPIVPGGMYFEPTASATNTMPIQLALSIVVFAMSLWRNRLKTFFDATKALPLLVITGAGATPTLLVWSNTGRYVGDFLPLLAIGTIFGVIGLSKLLQFKAWFKAALMGILIISGYFALVQFSLNVESWWFPG